MDTQQHPRPAAPPLHPAGADAVPQVPPLPAGATTADAAAPAPELPDGESLLQHLQQLLRELPGVIGDRVHLLALELKRSGLALAQMVGLVVAVGVLLCTAWLALWVGIGVGLVQAGLGWGWTLLLVLLLNLGAAWLAAKRALSLARFLSLPATVRRLTATHPAPPSSRNPAARSHDDAAVGHSPHRPLAS